MALERDIHTTFCGKFKSFYGALTSMSKSIIKIADLKLDHRSNMLHKIVLPLLIFCSFATLYGQGQQQLFPDPLCFCDLLCGPNHLGLGPETYYMERKRDGERAENGWMFGERLYYERLRPNCLYYGAEQYYAVGCISRRTQFDTAFVLKMIDAEVEGRFGYTLYNRSPISVMFTPFVGYGNFTGTSKYIQPHFLRLTFHPTFDYFTAGFLSAYFFCNGFASIGLNMKYKFMHHGINKVIDRTHDDCRCVAFYQSMGNRTHIQVDVPFTYYYWCCREQPFEISIVPFYRNRIYGGQNNFHFDFIETNIQMWGGRFMLVYVF